MSDFEDFQTKVDRLKAETDAEIVSDRRRSNIGNVFRDMILQSLAGVFAWLAGALFLFAGAVAGLVLGYGVPIQLAVIVSFLGLAGLALVFTLNR